jgi:hypothetical protein
VPFGAKSTQIGRISVYDADGRCGYTLMGRKLLSLPTRHRGVKRELSRNWLTSVGVLRREARVASRP